MWLVAGIVWLVASLVVYATMGPEVEEDTGQLLAFGVLLVAGAAWTASRTARILLNGAVGGVVGLAVIYVGAVVLAFMTANATAAEGESAFSLLIEGPFWVALFSPIAAMIGILGAAIRYLVVKSIHRVHGSKGA